MLYYAIIGIVCVAVAPVGILGFKISNETGMEDSNRNFGNRFRKLLSTKSESFKLDLSDDFVEDFPGTRQITTKILKRKRGIIRTNFKDITADAEIDMNKRIERLARESSQHGIVEDSVTDPNKIETTIRPEINLKEGEDDGRRLKRRIRKKRRKSFLNPFKRKQSYDDHIIQNNICDTTRSTPCMGIFEKKMKEFRAEQRLKCAGKSVKTTQPCEMYLNKKGQELTTITTEKNEDDNTETTLLPVYVTEKIENSRSNDDLFRRNYVKNRQSLLYRPRGPTKWWERGYRRRRKRGYHCHTGRRKKEPPYVCLPFIKRGQDELLTFLINVMQGMMEKSCNSRRPYALDKIWYRAVKDDAWESLLPYGQTICETAPCQKISPCGSLAILPFPLPFPPCTNLPILLPPTTLSDCPPSCPTTTPLPIMPIPQPCSILCSEKTESYPSLKRLTTILPTFLPPWPTTKPCCPDLEFYPPIKSQFESNVVGHSCLDTFPPWPTPPTFMKISSDDKKIPMYRDTIEKPINFPETNQMEYNTDETTFRKYEFQTAYDNGQPETSEQSDIDMQTRLFDYDRETQMDQSIFDLSPPLFDLSKTMEYQNRPHHRRCHPKTEFSDGYLEPYLATRQKRNEINDESFVTTTIATTVDIPKISETENSNHRYQYDSFVDVKRTSTMRVGIIGLGPKIFSSRQGKTFQKVYPESYPEQNHVDISTAKVEKTTNQIGTNPSSLLHLQLLAVCEGYLDMIKSLNMKNQSIGENDLIKYCENELSNGFDSVKAKKSIETTTVATSTVNLLKQLERPVSRKSIRNKVVVDILRSPLYREMRSRFFGRNPDRTDSEERRRRRKKRIKGLKRMRLSRRTTTEMADSIRLLQKKKDALVSWLIDNGNVTAEEEKEDCGEDIKTGNNSSTTSVRRKELSATPQPETAYPVYAKMYGYDKGGELSDIEVLLRSLNERNETREIAKNMTVLAMLMNPEEEERDTGLVEDFRSELKLDSAKFGGKAHGDVDWKKSNGSSTTTEEEEVNEMIEEDETTQTEVSTVSTVSTTIHGQETTHTTKKIQSRNGTYAQAVSSAKELVKDYTIDFLNYAVYIIPIMFILLFLVCCLCFILKIMIHNRKKKKKAKKKRKVTVSPSSESDSETSESSVPRNPKKSNKLKNKSQKLWSAVRSIGSKDEEGGITRKWKKVKKKNREELDSEDGKLLKKLRRKKKGLENLTEGQNEERALVSNKRRVSYGDSNDTDEPDTRVEHQRNNLAEERRELIALLEELKNLEDRDKKESKSVFVQYMTTDYDNEKSDMAFQRNMAIYSDEDRPLIHNGDYFRKISEDLSAELLRGNPQDISYKFELLTRMIDSLPMRNVSQRKKSVLIEEMENFKRRLNHRKYKKLKDSGVLCRP